LDIPCAQLGNDQHDIVRNQLDGGLDVHGGGRGCWAT
jgi:hypothetical protein